MRELNLVDVAVRQYGTLEALFDLAALNGLRITDTLAPGQALRTDTGRDYPMPRPATAPQAVTAEPVTSTVISSGQNLVDVALQELGHVEALFDLAALNGLRITDTLAPGQVLAVDPARVLRRPLVTWYSSRNIRINTGRTRPLEREVPPPQQSEMVDWDPLDFDENDWY